MNNAGIHTNTKRISNRERMRRAAASIQAGLRAEQILLAVLAQKGGEVVVTQGTINQVGMKLASLGYEIVPNAEGTEFTVRMLEGDVPDSPVHATNLDPVSVIVDDPTPAQELPIAV